MFEMSEREFQIALKNSYPVWSKWCINDRLVLISSPCDQCGRLQKRGGVFKWRKYFHQDTHDLIALEVVCEECVKEAEIAPPPEEE